MENDASMITRSHNDHETVRVFKDSINTTLEHGDGTMSIIKIWHLFEQYVVRLAMRELFIEGTCVRQF